MFRWILYGVAGLAIAGIGFYIKHIFDAAASVPALQAQIAQDATTQRGMEEVTKNIIALAQKNADDKIAAIAQYQNWETNETIAIAKLKQAGSHVTASITPSCFPAISDRELRNRTIDNALAGSGENASQVGVPARASGD